jgi:hypothetical protein
MFESFKFVFLCRRLKFTFSTAFLHDCGTWEPAYNPVDPAFQHCEGLFTVNSSGDIQPVPSFDGGFLEKSKLAIRELSDTYAHKSKISVDSGINWVERTSAGIRSSELAAFLAVDLTFIAVGYRIIMKGRISPWARVT